MKKIRPNKRTSGSREDRKEQRKETKRFVKYILFGPTKWRRII